MLLKLISWPYVRKHALRTALTTAGIVLGVAVFVGMRIANQTVLLAFSQTIDRIAGKTELEITAGDTGFGEDVLDKVQSASFVRVAVPVIEAVVDSNIPQQGNLRVLAIDMTGDRSLRDYDLEHDDDAVIDDPLVFLAQPDSIILTKEFAARNGIHVRDRLPLGTVEGVRWFNVRGLIKLSGLASAFGGNIVIMDVYAAQKMFGRGRHFDRIDLALKSGVTLAQGQDRLSALLGPAFEVRPPASRGQQFEAMLASYLIMANISGAFALFIGMFIIYNAFSIAVAQRRAEIGILRALGATQGQIRSLFLAEGALLGLGGSLAGAALGLIVARAIASSIGLLIADLYGVAQRVGDLAANPIVLVLAITLGIVSSVLAAALPAVSAARLDPVSAMQKGKYQRFSARESHGRVVLAAGLGALSLAGLLLSQSRWMFYVGYACGIGAVLLLGPFLTVALARAFRPVLKWAFPVEGSLAADSLIQAPRRTSSAVTALMLSLALVVAFSGMGHASYDSIVEWMDVTLNPDLFVMPSQNIDLPTARLPPAMAPEIAAVPGVGRVQMFRNGRIRFRDKQVMVVALEMSSVAVTAPPLPIAGDVKEMYRLAAAGEGVIISDNLAELHQLRLGETIEVPAPYGIIRLPIVGIIVDYSDSQGAIQMDRSVFTKYWRDDSVSNFRVYVAPGASVADVRRRIIERYAGQRQVFVMTNQELKRYILNIAGQWFNLTSVQIAVAVLVAILGIVNTLTVSIADRRREFGVLRAVGGLRWQVRGSVWIEAVTVAAIGLFLGCSFGAINLYYVLDIIRRDVIGLRLDYVFPLMTIVTLVPTILGAGFLASLWPAESAVRGPLLEALEYE